MTDAANISAFGICLDSKCVAVERDKKKHLGWNVKDLHTIWCHVWMLSVIFLSVFENIHTNVLYFDNFDIIILKL